VQILKIVVQIHANDMLKKGTYSLKKKKINEGGQCNARVLFIYHLMKLFLKQYFTLLTIYILY